MRPQAALPLRGKPSPTRDSFVNTENDDKRSLPLTSWVEGGGALGLSAKGAWPIKARGSFLPCPMGTFQFLAVLGLWRIVLGLDCVSAKVLWGKSHTVFLFGEWFGSWYEAVLGR